MLIRISLVTFLAVMGALVFAACGDSADDSEPVVGDVLRIYNWEDFFGPTTLADFEEEYGIEVVLEFFEDEDEQMSVITSDTSLYDLFITSDDQLGTMAAQRLVAELDRANIPNLSNIDPAYLDLPSDPGNKYSVPYDWGTTGVIYNTTCIQPESESWGVLGDPLVAGRVAMDGDDSVVIGSVLKYLGHSLNTEDREDLADAVQTLQGWRSSQNLQILGWTDIRDGIVSGDLCAAQVFNGDATLFMAENEDLDFFVPSEGSDLYFDVLAVPRDAPNKAGAELFINFILRPDVHAAINNYTGYASPNMASIEQGFIDDEFLSDPVSYPDAGLLEAWDVFDTAQRALWNEAWADFERSADTLANQ